MPGRKGKKNTTQQTPQDPRDPQEEAFERLSESLTATFSQGFDKLQQAMLTMANQPQTRQPASPPAKRSADDDIPGYNTRNKNLRPLYNPNTDPPQKRAKKKPSKPSAAASKPADAIDVDERDVNAQPAPQATAAPTSVRHSSDVNTASRASSNDIDLAMNDWIIGQAHKPLHQASALHLPTSTANMPNDPSLEAQVHQVLLNTASHLAKGNQKTGFYAHNYVSRGLEQKKMGLNSLTVLEYLHVILRMVKDQAVPSNIKPYLYSHLEELIKDAREYDWATAVRPYRFIATTLMTPSKGRLPSLVPSGPLQQILQNKLFQNFVLYTQRSRTVNFQIF